MVKHEATSPPATATAVVGTVALKPVAKTPLKAKGWKKWKRRLSRVFTGKKKPKGSNGSPLVTTRDPARPLDLRDPRTHKERTDGSPTGSHKGGDRQSTESRVWRREPASHEPRSTESRSAKEPTDEEWEAEQRLLAYHDEYDYEEDEGELLDEGEYAEEAEAGDQEDADMAPRSEADEEQEEELAEDVFEYEESHVELSQSEGQVEVGVYEGNHQAADTEEYVPEEEEEDECLPEEEDEGDSEESHGTLLEVVYDGQIKDTEVDSHAQCEEHGEVTTPVADLTHDDACSGNEDYGDEPANDTDWQAELQAEAASLSASEDATALALDYINEGWTPEGDEDGEAEEELSNCEAEDNPEGSPIALSCPIETCVATPPYLSKDPYDPTPMGSFLESIPPHIPPELHDIAAWCCDPSTPTTADSRLLLASLTHAKWALAQLVAEKLQRDHTPCSSSAASTEILLEAMLAA